MVWLQQLVISIHQELPILPLEASPANLTAVVKSHLDSRQPAGSNDLLKYQNVVQSDPQVKDLDIALPVPDPALNQSQARSVLEYLRSVVK
jgi:hypothetical protein